MHQIEEDLDPFKFWQTIRDISVDTWSKMIVDLLNTKTYAKTTSMMLNSYLLFSLPSQQILEKLIIHALAKAQTPTRKDINKLAEELLSVDTKIDNLSDELKLLRELLLTKNQVKN
jgi:hypothetical protein